MHEVCGTSRVWNLRGWRRSGDVVQLGIGEESIHSGGLLFDGHDEWMVEDVRSSPNEVIVELIERGVRCEC